MLKEISPGCSCRSVFGLSLNRNGFFCASLSFKQNTFLDLLFYKKKKKTQALFSAISMLHVLYYIFSSYKLIAVVLSGSPSSSKCIYTKNMYL